MASIDLAATLDGLQQDLDVRTSATALIADITSKLPGGILEAETPLAGDIDALLRDARALVLGRAMLQTKR